MPELSEPFCERSVNGEPCTAGPGGAPAQAIAQVDGRWYCQRHIAAAKAVASKRRDRGFGACSVAGCSRPAAEQDGKCEEHRAAERAAGAPTVVIDDGSGRGGHPYDAKLAVVYLAVFPDLGVLKVGKATPWTVRSRVAAAADKLRIRQADDSLERPIIRDRKAWFVPLFGKEAVLWSVSERVEHAAAGKLARSFVVAADRVLTGLPNPLEIARVRTADTYRVVDAITEAVRQDGVVHGYLAALSLGAREVLVGRHPVAQLGGDRLEVARATKLLGAEAFGHLACELRDVTLLSCLDEDSLHAERLQLGCSRSTAFRIPLNPDMYQRYLL